MGMENYFDSFKFVHIREKVIAKIFCRIEKNLSTSSALSRKRGKLP